MLFVASLFVPIHLQSNLIIVALMWFENATHSGTDVVECQASLSNIELSHSDEQ